MPSTVVDIFCGVGGLTHGFLQEHFNVVAGIDNDESCRYAYETNNPGARFIHASVEDVDAADIQALYPEGHTKILVGCAPCQDFSTYTRKTRTGSKWGLVDRFASLIEQVGPDIVSMENVLELETFNKGSVFTQFVQRLEAQGYKVSWFSVYCPDYGIPQHRKRLVLFAARERAIDIIPPTHTPENYRTVEQTIGNLPPIAAGEMYEIDPLHKSSALSELNLRRIRQSRPGGTWHDWDEELRAGCHKKESGESYISVYGRMSWNAPAPTITTQAHGYGNGRFGHPEQDRAISLREAALLQTFPQNYQFVAPGEPSYFSVVCRHIGNAVPVRLGQVIAQSIKHFLEGGLND